MPALFITASALGDTTLVAAVAGKRIAVRSLSLSNGAATANTVKFRSAATDLTPPGPVTLPAAVGADVDLPLASDKSILFQTAVGELLAINLSAATAVYGGLFYTLE